MTFEQRYNKLDDLMKRYFKQETIIAAWNKNADDKNAKMKEFNENKPWWKPKKTGHFPRYFETPVRMPDFFPIPPIYHKQYKQTKKLIEDYLKDYNEITP